MKYVMMEDTNGGKVPIIFPDALVHVEVAELAAVLMGSSGRRVQAVSAGFVSLGLNIECHGESESLGDMKAKDTDAAYIALGDSVSFCDEGMAMAMFNMAKSRKEKEVEPEPAP